jgi:hypothetical protein
MSESKDRAVTWRYLTPLLADMAKSVIEAIQRHAVEPLSARLDARLR